MKSDFKTRKQIIKENANNTPKASNTPLLINIFKLEIKPFPAPLNALHAVVGCYSINEKRSP